MKVVVAPDSFKGSLSAIAVAGAIARGVLRADPHARVIKIPIADGGEGTVDAMVAATGGRYVLARVSDPLGRTITAKYGLIGGAQTAVIEMAAASGLPLLSPRERNPMRTSTLGTGQLILHAAKRGAREIILGIGGSATVDAGTGMARALGIRFLDAKGRALSGGGDILRKIRTIDMSQRTPLADAVKITVACDVTNPLTGRNGAAFVYGPQKGATQGMVRELDKGLRSLAVCIRRDIGVDVERIEGAGAAGGLGAGLVAFLGAELKRGIAIVIDAVGLEESIRTADVVFTGEGRVDAQSACGKAVSGVARIAKRFGVPCLVVAGAVDAGASGVRKTGATAMFSIARGPAAEAELVLGASQLVEGAAEEAMRAFLAGAARGAHKR